MKHFLQFFLFALLLPAWGLSQEKPEINDGCGISTSEQDVADEYRIRPWFDKFVEAVEQAPNRRATYTQNLHIKCWVMRRTIGKDGVSPAAVDSWIAEANRLMTYTHNGNTYKTKLVRCGPFHNIDNWKYFNYDAIEEADMRRDHYRTHVINVYFVNSLTRNGSALCGYAYYPQYSPAGEGFVVMDKDCGQATFIHEIGHALRMYHTHETAFGPENVARSGGNKNCGSAGDQFCDTPADPNIYGKVNYACAYTGTVKDRKGVRYTPDARNIMSYSYHHCRTQLSKRQKMRAYWSTVQLNNGGNCCNCPRTVEQDTEISEDYFSNASAEDVLPADLRLAFSIAPNPVMDQLQLRAGFDQTSIQENIRVTVLDLSGKVMKTVRIGQIRGFDQVSIPVAELSSGMYLLQVSNGYDREVIRFVKN